VPHSNAGKRDNGKYREQHPVAPWPFSDVDFLKHFSNRLPSSIHTLLQNNLVEATPDVHPVRARRIAANIAKLPELLR
jgi:hypothetical protein